MILPVRILRTHPEEPEAVQAWCRPGLSGKGDRDIALTVCPEAEEAQGFREAAPSFGDQLWTPQQRPLAPFRDAGRQERAEDAAREGAGQLEATEREISAVYT